jgi:hypothetical protein
VLAEVGTAAMQVFLDRFSLALPERVDAALLLDGAGWHIAGPLAVPANISLVFLPPYAPELNPVERVRLYLRERLFSLRLFLNPDRIIEGCCQAWDQLTAKTGRIVPLTNYTFSQSELHEGPVEEWPMRPGWWDRLALSRPLMGGGGRCRPVRRPQ